MYCRTRDVLLKAYFKAQKAQAKSVFEVIRSASTTARLNRAVQRSNVLRMAVSSLKAEVEAHEIQHGCGVH